MAGIYLNEISSLIKITDHGLRTKVKNSVENLVATSTGPTEQFLKNLD